MDGQQGNSSLSLSHLLFFSSVCRRSLHSGFWFLFLGAERFISRPKRNLPKVGDVGAFGRLPLVPPPSLPAPRSSAAGAVLSFPMMLWERRESGAIHQGGGAIQIHWRLSV